MISAIIRASEDVLSPRMATCRKSNSASPSESHKTNIFVLTISQMNNKNK